jgi:hypothetical protein
MNDPEENELDAETLALLRVELAPASAETKARVSTRLVQSVGALALSRGAAAPSVDANRGHGLLGALRARPLGFVVSFAFGTAFGAELHRLARRPEPAHPVSAARAITEAPPVPSAAPALPAPQPPPSSSQRAQAPAAAVAAPRAALERGEPASLAEQQALLDVARSAFARNDYAATLKALNEHFRRYPTTLLGEEREALEIKVLAATGRADEAKARAVRFKARFPQSLLMPSVNDSVGAIP